MTRAERQLAGELASGGWCPTPPAYLPRLYECTVCDRWGAPNPEYPCRRCQNTEHRAYLDLANEAVQGWMLGLLWAPIKNEEIEVRINERRCRVRVGDRRTVAPTLGEALAEMVEQLWNRVPV